MREMEPLNRKCLMVGVVTAIFFVAPLSYSLLSDWAQASWMTRALLLLSLLLFGSFSAILLHMSQLIISRSHTLTTALAQYIIMSVVGVWLKWKMWNVRKTYKNPAEAQEKLLQTLLDSMRTTEYGIEHNLAQVKDRQDLKRRHPLTTYDHYVDYVKKIQEDGDLTCIMKSPVTKFNVSSGTTGKPKHLMVTKLGISHLMANLGLYHTNQAREIYGCNWPMLQCRTMFNFWPVWRYSKSGIPIGPASQELSKRNPVVDLITTTPPLSIRHTMPESGKLYIHWLYALADRNLGELDFLFGGALVRSVEWLLDNYHDLADDLRRGAPSRREDIANEVFVHLRDSLPADPERADEIERECNQGSEGIIRRLFPHLVLVSALSSAAQKAYHRRMRKFCGADLPVISRYFVSSEGPIGVSDAADAIKWSRGEIEVMDYLVDPNFCIFEFIPLENVEEEQPDTKFIEEIEIGKEYEIVLTSLQGFVRYRMGDIVKVTRFKEKCPMIDLFYRQGNLLDLRGEKTNEAVLQESIQEAAAEWDVALIDWSSTETIILNEATNQELKLGYILFIEITGNDAEHLSKESLQLIDKNLIEKNGLYRQFREIEYLEECRIIFVRPGTFEELMRYILHRNGAVSNQFKTPRTFKDTAIVTFLWERRVK